ncbi:TPA: AbiJ-NTD4 domain-containing protein [Enterobacter chengduensis]|uniref:HEPN AbiJ-N-terminal domain-containing protein n=2 Tax=Enterobacter TaxID=547 RepID=A0ABV4JL44_9ENTR|nr:MULTISPECIES: hypothetical protein [Enterobacter cloacae complex]HCR0839132.1 hypothetical protein [Enterobacter cancerogenus]MCK1099865.1 hypothetical protein [Enterobacter chengduensis]MCM7519546.1 hypothetical protein [Enterobacter chengduensis]CZZ93190.1 Uncharacterised protein [Enterobacter cloacae]HBM9967619.1 hypothetical protein [Enterobacter chengduensis]
MSRPFSQRYGHVVVEDIIQTNDLNQDSRVAIWNCLYTGFFGNEDKFIPALRCARAVWREYLNRAADKEPSYSKDYPNAISLLTHIKTIILQDHWYRVYDLVEFIIGRTGLSFDAASMINKVFKKKNVGYTIIDDVVTPISNEVEVNSVQSSIDNGTDSSRAHFDRALHLLTDREQPDFRNSIKESISAVESLCKKISGNDKGTLGDCLKTIEDKGHIHPAMKRAFQQLYGYTSDQGGIRHALMDDSEEPSLEEARYMLVICSAFSNYLISKMSD